MLLVNELNELIPIAAAEEMLAVSYVVADIAVEICGGGRGQAAVADEAV